jgi:hypothetical protein
MVLLSLIGFNTSPTFATDSPDSLYEVEIVVFQNILPELEGDELWVQNSSDSVIPELKEARIVSGKPSKKTKLSETIELLNADKNYRVLAHKRWVQRVDTKSSTIPVRIKSDKGLEQELDGTIKFYLTRFLRLDLNLLFRDISGATFLGQPEVFLTPVYRIDDQRRMRSNEVNYIDHPKFGALVRVSPTR